MTEVTNRIRSTTKSIINILDYVSYDDNDIVNIFQSFIIKQTNVLNIIFYDEYIIEESDNWPIISFKFYNTVTLWWLIAKYNQVIDPFEELVIGEKILVIKPELISSILLQLKNI